MNQPNALDIFKTAVDILGGETHPGEAYNAALNNVLIRKIGDDFQVEVRFAIDIFARIAKDSAPVPPEISVNWPAIGSVDAKRAFACAEAMQSASIKATLLELTFARIDINLGQFRKEQEAMSEAAKDAREALPDGERTRENIIKGALERLAW
jgi:hypothetical protein